MSEMGHVKRDPATGHVAIRTMFPENQSEQLANMAWLIATPNIGARHAKSETVESWEDLYVPEPPEVPEDVPFMPPVDPLVDPVDPQE